MNDTIISGKMDYKTIVDIIGSLGIVIGVFIAWRTLKADHERQKKQATIEFYNTIRKEYDESLKLIDSKFPDYQIVLVDKVIHDPTMLDAIRKYLYNIEMLSVGINTGIYDLAVFERMSGVYTTTWYERLQDVILYFRRNYRNPIAYSDFEGLVAQLRYLRIKRFPKHGRDLAKMKYDR